MHRISRSWVTAAMFVIAVAGASIVQAGSKVASQSGLTWSEGGIPGVSTAVVEGDLAKGPSRFYLRYAAGFTSPMHHHSPDHYVTTVSGTLVLTVDGKEQKLAPGSYFALTGKAPHVARCEASTECVMFIQAMGPWDVVAEK